MPITDEELDQLIERFGKATEGDDEANNKLQPTQVTLPDGSQVQGTPEELNQLLLQKLNETKVADTNKPAEKEAPAQPVYSFDNFQTRFMEDPAEGLKYLNISKYGFDPIEAILKMAGYLQQVAPQFEAMQSQYAVSGLKDFKDTIENKKILEDIILARQWQKTPQSYTDAHAIAQAEGKFKVESKPLPAATDQDPPVDAPFYGLPESVGSSTGDITGTNSSLTGDQLQKAKDMPLDRLRDMIESLKPV